MIIEIFKISYFSFPFKVNENKKVPLNNMVSRWRVSRKFLLEEDLIFNKRVGNISKKGAWQERGGDKMKWVRGL